MSDLMGGKAGRMDGQSDLVRSNLTGEQRGGEEERSIKDKSVKGQIERASGKKKGSASEASFTASFYLLASSEVTRRKKER